MKLIPLIAVVVFLTATTASAQTFTNNREKFVKEFQKTLSDFGKGEYHEFSKRQFPKLLLETSNFPENYFTKMVETCNEMMVKKLDPFPEIYDYVFSVYSFVIAKQSNQSYEAWHSSVDKLLDNKNIKKFEDFIELSATFFSQRKLSVTSNFSWFYEGGEYEFKFTDKPFIKFSKGNLICRLDNKNKKSSSDRDYIDSLVIYNTDGTYDPILKKWDGNGGNITWEKVGANKKETFATLRKYDLSCKAYYLNADTVALTTPYFTRPILGSLSDKAITINREIDRVYPQFLSFEKRLAIKEIMQNVDYQGGFSLQGADFVGVGSAQTPASITISKNGKPLINSKGQYVIVSASTILINNSWTTFALKEGDSLQHKSVNFNYDISKNLIEMTRKNNGNGQPPFQDSYHNIDIFVPKITYNMREEELVFTYEFGTSQEQRIANFESKNFFDERLYDRLQGLDKVNPLFALYQYSYSHDEYVLSAGKAATALGKTIEQVKGLLIELSNYGFITYDIDGGMITMNPKLENFVKSKQKTQDYDNLNFVSDLRSKTLKGYSDEEIKNSEQLRAIQEQYKQQSETRRLFTNFGKLDLKTLYINLIAVDNVRISDLQNTLVFPNESKITIKQNRNFEFSGWINAGKMEINLLAGNYNYKENKFHLNKTSESLFRVKPLKVEDGQKNIAMGSSICGIMGELFVDAPTNRSGNNVKITNFPKLTVNIPSKVFYNSKNIYGGVYDSTRFYYVVAPFEMDSLDNFSEKFFFLKGELISAGIFPKITQDLKIMPDYSFGFSTNAPEGGFDFYGTGAKYENKIVLSNNGLQGAGKINFVQSTSISKALTFLPDSTIGYAQFTNRPSDVGTQFPDIESENAFINYVPRKNYLTATSTEKNNLKFFKAEGLLRGTAIVTKAGIKGRGEMVMKNSTSMSDNYVFKRWDMDADTSGFSLRNVFAQPGDNPFAFQAKNVKTRISFKERAGEFMSNKGTSEFSFPDNQYMCKLDKFIWKMDAYEIELESNDNEGKGDKDLELGGANFFSTHPKQDTLQFSSRKAKFDLRTHSIYCEKVEFVQVADARIYPDSMKITIRQKAKMDLLSNAKIVANSVSKYYKFINANLEISARRKYEGTADYPYYDADSIRTIIHMKSIQPDTTYQTVAIGDIAEQQGFKLSKYFDFYGTIKILAADPLIQFDGATRINHTCKKFDRTWMSFNAPINPKNIQIPVSEKMKNLNGTQIAAGIIWRDSPVMDSVKLYPTFLSKLTNEKDPIVITASGLLQYNMEAKEFQIGSKEKLINRAEQGNFLALHTESCSMEGEGIVHLGMDYGDARVETVGVVSYNQETGKTEMNLTARYSMPIDRGILEDAASKIDKMEGLKPMSLNSTTLEQALVEWSDRKLADKFKSDYTTKGEIKNVPDALETSTFVITGLKLSSFDKPSMEENGIISATNTACLVNIYKKSIMKEVPIRVFYQQIYSQAGGDRFGLQIDLPAGNDYYFDYLMGKRDGELRIISGNSDMNSAISSLKADKRSVKNFKFDVSTQRIYLSKFLRLFE